MIRLAVPYQIALAFVLAPVPLIAMADRCEKGSSEYPANYPKLVEVVKNGKTHILEGMDGLYFSYLAIDLIESSDINLGDLGKSTAEQHPYKPFIPGNRAQINFSAPVSVYIKANRDAVKISEIMLVFHRDVKTNQRVQIITREEGGKKVYTKYHAGHILYALVAIINGLGRITPAEP